MPKAKPFEKDPTPEERARFWSHVNTAGPNGCWIWSGAKTTSGYGKFGYKGKAVLAHRLAWFLIYGEDPPLEQLDHLCMTRECVNVTTHLEPATAYDNNMRSNSASARNKRKRECVNGHPFDEENTYTFPDGRRQCRTCAQASWRKNGSKKYEKEKQEHTHTSEMRDFAADPKLDWEKVREIRSLYATGDYSQRVLAKQFRVSQPMIGLIVRDEAWIEEE